ncbi:N-acetylornithine carbamoyltransferase [Fulvivirga lutimaris]|uniref:N-acetylornithine carbamoyltransferase n=1 Tax=Fulvivirga lutimaris TaxID=1819566 RepID=UPI0016295406|nr:N-acetylornithine carbamoyltransferase [Fulvivirga lutimaris]
MKNFTSIKDVPDVKALLQLAQEIKKQPYNYKSYGENKTLGLLFFNPSLRTRMSTQKAAQNLSMQVMVMNLNSDGWQIELEDGTVMNQGTQEHIKEAAGVISQYCDIMGVRTFPSLTDKEADYSEKVLNKFLEHSLIPVISLESATLHPLQSFADLITIVEQKKIAKPKVVLSWAPHVRSLPQAVSNSFAQWMSNADVDFIITNPEGFDLADEFTNGTKVIHDQDEALANADFVYAKNWSSYEDYGKIRTDLNQWQITNKKMALTNDGKFMHCLPVRRNLVVADEVLDSEASIVLQQANNRTYAAQAVLLNILRNGS